MDTETVPLAIRRSCSLLKVSLQALTKKSIIDAWKKAVINCKEPSTSDEVVNLNIAKDTLLWWLDEHEGESGVLAMRKPSDGGDGDAMSEDED